MEIKLEKKCFKNISLILIVITTAVWISESVGFCRAEVKSLITKRRAHDYDETYGFGLMNDEISVRHSSHVFKQGDEIGKIELVDKHNSKEVKGGHVSKSEGAVHNINKSLFPYRPDSDGIVFVGCFNVWMQNLWTYGTTKFNENYTHKNCSSVCQSQGLQLSFLRGGYCYCNDIDTFNLVIFSNEKCDVSCPVANYQSAYITNVVANQSCGGNTFFSVYCRTSSTEDCTNIPAARSTRIPPNDPPNARNGILADSKPLIQCASSSNDGNVLSPYNDYFPKNDPPSCIKFCSVNVTYMIGVNVDNRQPTKYAIMTWRFKEGHNFPRCRCTNDLKDYSPVDDQYCDTPCPGDPSKKCGSTYSEVSPVYATVYCTTDPCEDDHDSTEMTTAATTTSNDPCTQTTVTESCGDFSKTTEVETTTSTLPSTSISAVSTTAWPNSTISTPQTDQMTSDVVLSTTTLTPSTFMPSMPPDIGIGCNLVCKGTERNNGRKWEVCAQDSGEKDCRHQDSWGKVIWKCMSNGEFETDQPDYTGCHSNWVGDLENQTSTINDTASAVKYLKGLKNFLSESKETAYFGHEIQTFTTVLSQVVKLAGNFTGNAEHFEEIAETAVDVSQHLISTVEPWFEMGHELRSRTSTDLINTIEETSIHLTSKVNLSSEIQSYERELSPPSPGYYVSAGAMFKFLEEASSADPFEFPVLRSPKESFIKLPPGWKELVQGEKIEFVGMSMDPKYANLMLPGQFKTLGVDNSDSENQEGQKLKVINSQLMSFTLASSSNRGSRNLVTNNNVGRSTIGNDSKLDIKFHDRGVEITFEHDLEAWGEGALNIRRKLHPGERRKAALGTSQCVYWDTKNSIWSTEGCKLISNNRFHTVCQCDHLTSFAILVDVHNYVGKELGLEVLTLILSSLSFICLFVSVLIFSTIRGVQNIRTTITKNLSVCLLVGNTLVLLVLDRHYLNMSDGVCIASGIISHYVFLSAFIWMAIEGIHLYKMVVHVFDTENNPLNIYRLISYGVPLIIVAITVVIGYLKGDRPYGGDAVCWLDGAYIWSFMVPVAIVVMINFVILFIALKTAYQLQHNKGMPVLFQSRVRSFRTWIRGCFSLTVLLGLTWLVGFFTLIPSSPGVVAAYIFTILNASQGIFIFIYHCLLNDKIRFMTSKRFGSYLPSWLSSSINNSSGSQANEASGFGKGAVSNMKNSHSNSDFSRNEKSSVNKSVNAVGAKVRSKLKIPMPPPKDVVSMDETGGSGDCKISVITPIPTRSRNMSLLRRRDSFGTVSSVDSLPPDLSSGNVSDSGNNTDNSLRGLISDKKYNSKF